MATVSGAHRVGTRASVCNSRRQVGAIGWGLTIALLCQLSVAARGTAAVIDFEGAVPDIDHQQTYNDADPPYVEGGITVGWSEPIGSLIANNPAQDGIGNGPDPGSKYMSAIGASRPPVIGEAFAYMILDRADAQPFRISSLEISEYSSVFADPTEIHFVGTTLGGLVEQVYVTDGTNDGTGPLDDFELVLLHEDFTNLLSFEIFGISTSAASYAGFAVDDVSFDLVPEPGTALLLGVGLVALGRRRR